jgi:hypothetical protein
MRPVDRVTGDAVHGQAIFALDCANSQYQIMASAESTAPRFTTDSRDSPAGSPWHSVID